MKKLLLLTCSLFFLSCMNNSTKIKKDFTALSSSPIDIPTGMNVTYHGKDTVADDLFVSKLKFIVYSDSAGCASCGINKMFMWEPFLKYAQTYDGRLKFYFIFHPAKNGVHNLKNALALNNIDYPMLIDLEGDFEKSNPHLPKNKAMHTFLLDENNNVILIGNPLQNKEIEKLFYKKTQELLSK